MFIYPEAPQFVDYFVDYRQADPSSRPKPDRRAVARMLRLAPDGIIVTVLGLVGGALGGHRASPIHRRRACAVSFIQRPPKMFNASILQALAVQAAG